FFLLVHYFDPHWDYDAPEPYRNRFTGPYAGTITGKYASFSEFALPGTILPAADRQHLLDLYDGEIAYTDSQVCRLLEGSQSLGAGSPSVVVVVSDHGEEFKEHDSMGHGRNLYDEVLRVPLIIADSTRTGARRIRGQVRTVDLFPTLCRLGRATPPRGLQG